MNWWKDLKGKVRFEVLLKHYTTFKIGGPAKFFFEPEDSSDLRLLLKSVTAIPIFVLGRGSNILVSDKGVNGIVLRLSSAYFKKLSLKNDYLEVASGVSLNRLIGYAQDHGLGGLEFLAGIPGTLGGAVMMNAGVPLKNIGDLVENVTVIDYNGNIKILDKKNIKFGYRKTNLSNYIILSAGLRTVKKNKQEIRDGIDRYLVFRSQTQDLSKPSVGCIFKNPKRDSAGRLIDLCGLKGKRMGDACISQRHANFILNLKNARARDVLRLMELVKGEVRDRFNITLRPEIKIW